MPNFFGKILVGFEIIVIFDFNGITLVTLEMRRSYFGAEAW